MAAAYLAIATCRGERERHAWLEGGEPRTAAVVPLGRPPLKGLTQRLAESDGSNLRRKSPVPLTADLGVVPGQFNRWALDQRWKVRMLAGWVHRATRASQPDGWS